MTIVIMHHYVVNSEIYSSIISSHDYVIKNLIYLIFGCGGKIAINCFILINGYFMSKQTFNKSKIIKLLLEIEFYKILIYLIFLVTGYIKFNLKEMIFIVLPFTYLTNNFTGCYIVFLLFVPFFNIFLNKLTEKNLKKLLILSLIIFSIFPTLNINVQINYVVWFSIVYFIGAYIRKSNSRIFNDIKTSFLITIGTLILSIFSICIFYYTSIKFNFLDPYFLLIDCNKILSLLVAIFSFCTFKNLKIPYSKLINNVSRTTFGVFLIHTCNDYVRKFLWYDIFKNGYLFMRSKFSVII